LLQKLALAVVMPLVLLALLELLLRISPWDEELGPERFVGGLSFHTHFWDPNCPLPSPMTESLLEGEFRGKKTTRNKPAGVYRIISMGGSSTFGWPYNDRPEVAYPAQLERQLRAHPPDPKLRYEVLNAGIGGYSSFQGLSYMKKRLVHFSPDMVTVCFGANDGHNNHEIGVNLSDREYYERQQRLQDNKMVSGLRAWLSRLRLFGLMSRGVFAIKKATSDPRPRVPVGEFEQNLREYVKLGREHGFLVLLILEAARGTPDRFAPREPCPPLEPNSTCQYYKAIFRVGRDNRDIAGVLDTTEMLAENAAIYDELFYDVGHFTVRGNRIMGQWTYRAVKKLMQRSATPAR
jgi:lysophospholipase L1-like esterase